MSACQLTYQMLLSLNTFVKFLTVAKGELKFSTLNERRCEVSYPAVHEHNYTVHGGVQAKFQVFSISTGLVCSFYDPATSDTTCTWF